ncbi:MAG TPA: Ig-like domain repeat protein [Candidatus Polarisedimenticolaceae bacterium]|nr:Ig-like domain repeat protein [Candidatus Polarisedimenticolaceae bacterium]
MRSPRLRACVALGVLAFTAFTLHSSLPPAGSSGTWSLDGAASVARAHPIAVLLDDGRLLVAGGRGESGPVASAEVRGSDGSFTAVSSMGTPRSGAAAVRLPDGRVLVTGGLGADEAALASAELYDPAVDAWYDVPGGMGEARAEHTATRLADGRVLVAGGRSADGASATLETFDPHTGLFTAAGSMSQPRSGHAAALLDDGRVLLAGGFDGVQVTASTDLFDGEGGTLAAGPAMTVPRVHASATLLLDHRVLVAGGSDGSADLASTEMFDPLFDTVSSSISMGTPRQGHLALRLPLNNAALLAGGTSDGEALDLAELFLPWREVSVSTGLLVAARAGAALTPLSDEGQVLAVGGSSASAEAYRFATVWTDQDDYAPGTIVTMSGSGWEPGETVSLVLKDGRCTPRVFSSVADADGRIVNQDFSPEHHDIGIRFWLTATGSRSEAHTTFLDSPKVGALSVSASSPATVNQGGSATYTVTILRGTGSGSNGSFDVSFSFTTALPPGVTATFNPATVHFNPPESNKTATMTLTTTAGATPGGSTSFTLKGATSAQDFATGNGTLSVCAPQISSQPVGLTRTVGQSASFSVTASGGTYQWRKNGTNIAGATASTYAIAAVLGGDAGSYDVVVTDGCGSLTSSAATLAVNKASTTTSITADTPDPSVAGQAVSVSFSVSGAVPVAGPPTGNVTVSDGAGNSCVAPVSAGSCTLTLSTAGAKTLTASYAGDTSYAASSGNAAHTVDKASTATSITLASPDPSVSGQSVSVGFSVSPLSPGAGTPTGMVTVSDGQGASCSASVAAGTCALVFPTAGTRSLTASYAGDASFHASAGNASHEVNQANASVTASVSPSPSTVGQPVTVSWTVAAAAPGSGTPTGSVSVDAGDGLTCSAPVSAGSCALSFPTGGARTLAVAYGGDANFNPASASKAHSVTKANTTTTLLADSPSPSVTGQAVVVSWSVAVQAPGAGTPTGAVTVSDGTGASCSAAASAGSCTLTFASAGNRSLSVSFAGDAGYNPSADAKNHNVQRADTSVSATASPATSVVGQAVSVTWSVSVIAPGAGTPTGTVSVSDGAGSTCSSPVAAGGCSLSFPSAGARALSVSYAGDGDFKPSAAALSQQVDKADTSLSISNLSPSASVVGQSVSVSWSVSVVAPGAGSPSGNVTVNDGAGTSCSAPLAAGSCSVTFASAGPRSLSVSYSGDADFNGSSDSAAHQVDKADTSLSISNLSPSASVVGQPVSVSWSVSVVAPGAGSPSGNVTVDDGGSASCSAPLAAGSCSVSFASAGARSLSVSYAGDADFNGSSDSAAHQVDKADTSLSISNLSPSASVVGQPVSVSWSVSVVAPGAGSPSGNVTVDDGGSASCSAPLAAGSCSVTFASAGPRSLSVSYSGDADFNGSSDSAAHQVDKADTSLSIAALSASPSVVGQPVSVPWSVSVVAPGAGSPGGTVTVSDGTGASCSADVAAGSCSLAFVSPGPRTLSVAYAGDANFQPSAGTVAHQVDKAATTAAVLSDTPDPSLVDAPVLVTWSVSVNAPGAAPITGDVTVSDGTGASCSAPATAGSCSLVPGVVGPKTLSVVYAGDANLVGSAASTDHDVQKRASTSLLSCSANSVIVGATVSCTVTVSDSSAPGTASAPQGSVSLASSKPGSFAPASCTLSGSGGVSTCAVQYTASQPGVQALTASFAGDAKHDGSSGAFSLQSTYTFLGFFAPVENLPVLNTGKAGRTIPVKWQLKDAAGAYVTSLSTVVNNPLQYRQISCDSSAPQDPLPADTSGSSGLRYDASANQFVFTWQTSSSFAGKCYELLLDLSDGTQHVSRYKFTK